jgi:hypothetical protein
MPTKAALVFVAFAFTASASSELFPGRWVNENPETRGVTSADIRSDGKAVGVHVWGARQPSDCDWDEAVAEPGDHILYVTWKSRFATRVQELTLEGDNRLRVITRTVFTDDSGRSNTEITDFLKRQ